MNWMMSSALVLTAYLLGSFPTALVYSRLAWGKDIREVGDGNMGARNAKRNFGFRAGVLVACVDIFKGALAVWLAQAFDLPIEWQLLAGAAVILGHDFPVFARFKGGQGLAANTGVFLALFPLPVLIGFVIYLFLFLLFKNSDVAAGVGMGFVALHALLSDQPFIVLAFIVCSLLFIPLKQWLDRSRRVRIEDLG